MVLDFPDTKNLLEYEDYTSCPTKANVSSFITLALEENWAQVQTSEGYAKYITTRPRAEHLGDHGLFGDEDGVELDKAMSELEHYTGNVWTHIISLHRVTPRTWVMTMPRRGVLSCIHTEMTSPPPCTSRRSTSAGTPHSTMRASIHMST